MIDQSISSTSLTLQSVPFLELWLLVAFCTGFYIFSSKWLHELLEHLIPRRSVEVLHDPSLKIDCLESEICLTKHVSSLQQEDEEDSQKSNANANHQYLKVDADCELAPKPAVEKGIVTDRCTAQSCDHLKSLMPPDASKDFSAAGWPFEEYFFQSLESSATLHEATFFGIESDFYDGVDCLLTAEDTNDDISSCWQQLNALHDQGEAASRNARYKLAAALRRNGQLSDAEQVLAFASAANDPILAVAALEVGSRCCDPDWLESAISRLSKEGYKLPADSSASLVRTLGCADKALAVWRARIDLNPQEFATPVPEALLGAVLEVCLRSGDRTGAYCVAREAAWHVSLASRAPLLALIVGLAEHQDLARALEVYEGVRRNGMHADLPVYNALLTAAARDANAEKVSVLFRDLMEAGVEPDSRTFSTIIRGLCAAGELEQAMQLFAVMRRRSVATNVTLFNAILDGCARKGMRTLTEQVLSDMEAVGVLPSNATLAILVRLYGRERDLAAAFSAVEDLSKRHNLKVNANTYGALITACLYNSQLEKAMYVFDKMTAEGWEVSARTYESLIRTCLREGDLKCAVRLVENSLGPCPDTAEAAESNPQPPSRLLRPVRVRLEQLQPSIMASTGVTRVMLDPRLLEDMLNLIGRRRQAKLLGAPLIERLRAANVEFPEALVASMLSAAEQEQMPVSRFHARREVHSAWRGGAAM